MKEQKRKIKLSEEEFKYLQAVGLNYQMLTRLIDDGTRLSDDKFIVQVDLESAEQLRSHLTERLAKYGFDQHYSLTNEGRMLEDLIDKFYLH